jgi:hypothetical protein
MIDFFEQLKNVDLTNFLTQITPVYLWNQGYVIWEDKGVPQELV